METARANDFRGGCPLGSLASELADRDDAARDDVVVGYRRWQGAIRDGLFAMKARGALVDGADVDQLAMALLTALQGGLLAGQDLARRRAPTNRTEHHHRSHRLLRHDGNHLGRGGRRHSGSPVFTRQCGQKVANSRS